MRDFLLLIYVIHFFIVLFTFYVYLLDGVNQILKVQVVSVVLDQLVWHVAFEKLGKLVGENQA